MHTSTNHKYEHMHICLLFIAYIETHMYIFIVSQIINYHFFNVINNNGNHNIYLILIFNSVWKIFYLAFRFIIENKLLNIILCHI